jgi:hypothetical protein
MASARSPFIFQLPAINGCIAMNFPHFFTILSRALSDLMEPFDRDYFAPWSGALRMSMPRIGKEAQRRHGVKEPGLRWGVSAPLLRCDACRMRKASRFTPRLTGKPIRPSN